MSEFNNWKREENKQNQSEVERFGDDPSTTQREYKKRTEISEGNGYVRIGDEYYSLEEYNRVLAEAPSRELTEADINIMASEQKAKESLAKDLAELKKIKDRFFDSLPKAKAAK